MGSLLSERTNSLIFLLHTIVRAGVVLPEDKIPEPYFRHDMDGSGLWRIWINPGQPSHIGVEGRLNGSYSGDANYSGYVILHKGNAIHPSILTGMEAIALRRFLTEEFGPLVDLFHEYRKTSNADVAAILKRPLRAHQEALAQILHIASMKQQQSS